MANPEQPKALSKEDLLKEVDRLQKALAEKTEEVTQAKKDAAIFSSSEEEVPTGNSVEVTRCKGYKNVGFHDDGRPILRPEWHTVKEPTYWYGIDMPAIGGTDIKLNGREFYHGQTYEVTRDELQTLKDIVHRLWAHERSLHEDNEKVFRQHYEAKARRFFPKGAVNASGKKVIN